MCISVSFLFQLAFMDLILECTDYSFSIPLMCFPLPVPHYTVKVDYGIIKETFCFYERALL